MAMIYSEDWENTYSKLDDFLEFCLKYSEFIVLTKRTESIPGKILLKMAQNEIEEIKNRKVSQIKYAKSMPKEEMYGLGFKDEESLVEYLKWQEQDEIRTIREMERSCEDKKENLKENLRPFHLVNHEYKCGSFFTWPGVWDFCTFKKMILQ